MKIEKKNIKTFTIQIAKRPLTLNIQRSIEDCFYVDVVIDTPADILDNCSDSTKLFLEKNAFYSLYNSSFGNSHVVSNELAVEAFSDVLVFKGESIESLDNILLNEKDIVDDKSISLKDLTSIVEMTYEPIDLTDIYGSIIKGYRIDDIIRNFRLIIMVTRNKRYIISLYHKNFFKREEIKKLASIKGIGTVLELRFNTYSAFIKI